MGADVLLNGAHDHELRYTPRRLLGYASGSLAIGVFSTVPTVLLLYFCTQIAGIPAATAALIMFFPKAWALIWDPLVGAWSDAYRSSRGRRKPFMLVGGAIMALAFVTLFSWPYGQGSGNGLLVGLFYFALASAYSLFAIPYLAFPAEASGSASVRERIVSWRIAFGMAGLLTGSAGAPLLIAGLGGGAGAYAWMSVIVAAICSAGVIAAYCATPVLPVADRKLAWFSPVRIWRELGEGSDYRMLLLAYVLMVSGVSLQLASSTYWIVFSGGLSEAFVGIVMAAMMGSTILATPIWSMVVARKGARSAALIAALCYCGASLSLLVVGHGAFPLAAPILFMAIGAAFAGLQVAPFSLVAHLIHAHAQGDGDQREGLMSGIWSAGEKLGLACGAALAASALAIFGFISGASRQPDHTVAAIGWLIGIGPALLVGLSVPLLLRVAPTMMRSCEEHGAP